MRPIVYRPDGCVDFAATKAVRATPLTPEELQELKRLLASTGDSLTVSTEEPSKSKEEEFWSDTCWTEPHFSNPI